MALVNIDSVLHIVLQKLDKLNQPQGIELLSYKRNRSIAVFLLDDNTFLVRERGYREGEQAIGKAELIKHLKSLIKIRVSSQQKGSLVPTGEPPGTRKKQKETLIQSTKGTQSAAGPYKINKFILLRP